MLKPHPGKLDGELGVFISLVVSLGMVILTIIAWWLWKVFPESVGAMLLMRSIELP